MTTDSTVLDGLDFPTSGLAVPDDVADLLFRQARTVGAFTPEEVTDEQLAAVYDLVRWGPTALNTVPLRLLVVRTPEARARLAAHMNESNRERVLAAPVSLVLAADPGFHAHLPVLAPHMAALADALEPQPEQREQMARTSALLQVGYLIVGLRAAGLDVGPMSGMDAHGIDAEFFAESGWRSLLVVNVGRRDGVGTPHPRAARLDYDQVARTV
ncbi:malonic semialdehyde reductase [Cellulomonas fimi]|uniref:Nitroreductase n=1 Tax=Cellulomonas fimi (strain ATCC 484 / DSM 20113 / JCM 1341 / CCUG 24087 / LMG 16345 / NBRC 15513 / NCIMB 8980 / NCTC 7547 / NRS-133) TaxID=590998 RepID=F4H225_CELFA|nr:malonic semialdehyde reductase [Cellulomonas fimi]AEE45195.1 nitroreductase [Cellulomonas fimi ATCC 484]NNH09260.1 malonic semialdehyde reductase [Cellulomonas fimi]VEH28530.1 Probable malonic semialdehyde reductase RutE [Cellulomonas fimi]